MGSFAVRGWTRLGAILAAALVLALNLILLLQTVGVPITFG